MEEGRREKMVEGGGRMGCDIIIPIWDQLVYTRDCIKNLVRNTKYPYRLILIDNASDSETKQYLKSVQVNKSLKVVLIRNEENLGFIKAANRGLSISSAPYVCILNNDTVPAPGWLERMIDFAAAHDDIGLINPQCGGHLDTPIEIYAGILGRNKGKYMEMNQCQGFCMLIKRELIEKIGYLDESFGIGGFDDTDYSMRAHHAGYRCACIYDAYVYHRLHGSFDRAGDREDWVKKNQKIYYDKWGKHLRVGIIFSPGSHAAETISNAIKFAYGLAREWTWVHIWVNFRGHKDLMRKSIGTILARLDLPPHQNIRINYLNLPHAIFKLAITGKLLERARSRMRDKRFDTIIASDDKTIGSIAPFAKIMGAKLMKVSFDEAASDWMVKGREAAFVIKGNRANEPRGV